MSTEVKAIKLDAEPMIKNEPIDESDGIDLKTGECRGPFLIKKLAYNDEDPFTFTMNDQRGKKHIFSILKERDPILLRLTNSPNSFVANCILMFQSDQMITLMATRDIKPSDVLLGILIERDSPQKPDPQEKRYTCDWCQNAKFSNLNNLEVHKNQYCSSRSLFLPRQASRTPEHTSPRPLKRARLSPEINEGEESVLGSFDLTARPNFILLPLAYHNLPQKNAVQLLGPPQTIIPVAIGKPSGSAAPTSLGHPIFINEDASSTYDIPQSIKINLPNFQMITPILKLVGKQSSTPSSTSKPVEEPKEEKSKIVDTLKPFMCTCGVSFTAQSTLDAHKTHYCTELKKKGKTGDVEVVADVQVPQRSSSNESENGEKFAATMAKLSSQGNPLQPQVKVFICQLCNYRGYSFRGIRHHMRSHKELESLQFEEIMDTKVHKILGEEKP